MKRDDGNSFVELSPRTVQAMNQLLSTHPTLDDDRQEGVSVSSSRLVSIHGGGVQDNPIAGPSQFVTSAGTPLPVPSRGSFYRPARPGKSKSAPASKTATSRRAQRQDAISSLASPPNGSGVINAASDHQTSTQPSSSADQALGSSEFPPLNTRSVDFWYPDGNIVVHVASKYFRLLKSRLERHCEFFQRAFKDEMWTIVSGHKVVEVRDIRLQDFETLLKYLELPM